jgi:hypothetical protein
LPAAADRDRGRGLWVDSDVARAIADQAAVLLDRTPPKCGIHAARGASCRQRMAGRCRRLATLIIGATTVLTECHTTST